MELPNYSRQLLLQLHTLCKEQVFCDCTIFIGTMHFRAHKLILAAASLLFKSLLDDTDTISIDSSLVTAEEFTLLLEIVYTGKLPPGKHNFTKVISVADTLQMFDVAVSCKKLLTELLNRSNQSQIMFGGSVQPPDATRKALSEAPHVTLSADDDGMVPLRSACTTALSCRGQPRAVKILGDAEEVPDFAETTPEASAMVSMHGNSATKAACEAWGTEGSPGALETALPLEDPRIMGAMDFETVAVPNVLGNVANFGNVIDPAPTQVVTVPAHAVVLTGSPPPSEAMTHPEPHEMVTVRAPPSKARTVSAASEAATALPSSEAGTALAPPEAVIDLARSEAVTSPAPSVAVTGLTRTGHVTGSAPSEVETGPASFEVVTSSTPYKTETCSAPPEAVTSSTPCKTEICFAPSEHVTSSTPCKIETCSAPTEAVTSSAPSETKVCLSLSEVEIGLQPSEIATGKAPAAMTGPVPSEATTGPTVLERVTALETSRLVTGLAPSGMVTANMVSGLVLAMPTVSKHLLAPKTMGTVATSAEVKRFSSPLEPIPAVSLAELEAGDTTKVSQTFTVSAKSELTSKHKGDSDSQIEAVAHIKVVEQESSYHEGLVNEECNSPTLQTFSACSDEGTANSEEEDMEPPLKKGRYINPDDMGSCSDLDFLLQYGHVFSEAFSDSPIFLQKLSNCRELEESEKQVLLECCQGGDSKSAFERILEKVKTEQTLHARTVMYALELCRDTHPKVEATLLHREQMITESFQKTESQDHGKTLFGLLLEHREDLIQSITELSPIIECLDTAEDGFLSNLEKKVILDCCEGRSHREAVEDLLKKVTDEKALGPASLVKLLQAVKEAFPDLCLLLDTLEPQEKIAAQLNPEEYGIELLRQYHENMAEILTDPQVLLRGLDVAVNLAPRERLVIEQIVKKDTLASSFGSLASAVLEEKTLSAMACWQLVLALQEGGFPLNMLLEDIQREPGAELFFQSVVKRETVATEMLLRHSELIAEAIRESRVLEWIGPGEEGLNDAEKELLSILCEKEDCGISCAKQFLTAALEKSLPTLKFCQFLCSLHESIPNLQPLMQELEQMGLLIGGDGEMKDIRKWKVNNEYQIEALDKVEGPIPQPLEVGKAETVCGKDTSVPLKKAGKRGALSSSKKSYVCKYCNKIFHFRCRLEVHVKRCKMAFEKSVQCPECNQMKASQKELERHRQEAHGYSSTNRTDKVKKKRLQVTCDICGKEFAHPSGMQYHKRTEHFDEKPFSCIECGAKFAANSTLKNHQRLHTGERPYVCKHCQMTFTQAAALAYHTKKKHSEGKMYACQYCEAVFAQSIELTRHVRTHTGDKPYVCKECGKGFSQANGLSIHLRTFHNIEDPYDCQKCRMSFPSLDEHRKHIQAIHARDYHPCTTCEKIFSAPSLLERHMVTHVGGKPYNCEICDKAYQQLSGLWYHNRTHHPDIFAAQNHRSSKFTSLVCIACDKGFSTAIALQKHVKAEHADMKLPECDKCQQILPSPAALQVHMKCKHSGAQPFQCLYCTDAFRFPGALQHHVATEHFSQTENTFGCQLCGELFISQTQLQRHYETDHPEVVMAEAQATSPQVVQVMDTPEPLESSEQTITLEESQLAGSRLLAAGPESQESQVGSELVTVSVNELLADTVTVVCGETK